MIDSMQITSQGNGPYGMTMGPNGTMTVTNGNISGTLTAPPGTTVTNMTIVPSNYTHLDGTWTYVDGNGTTSGQITFGTDIVTNNKYDERFYGFTGIFSGEHIKGTHAYVVPGMP
jgi:hypothetical protein